MLCKRDRQQIAVQDGKIQVDGVCIKNEYASRAFYPYLLLLSAIFLLLTIIVYTRWPQVMDCPLAHLRRHFAICMFFAFVVQSVQFWHGKTTAESDSAACGVLGTLH